MSAELVRVALDRLTDALTVHLVAVENRSGEHDAAVQAAYEELRAAAAAYDETLYEIHDEITPFDLPEGGDTDPAAGDDADDVDPDPDRLSLLGRWDFTILDRDRLRAAADKITDGTESPAYALTALAAVYGAPRLSDTANAEGLGLHAHGGTTWVVESDVAPDDQDLEWLEDPFTAEPADVLCRYDIPVRDQPAG